MPMREQGEVAGGVNGAAVQPLTLAIYRGALGSQGAARSVRWAVEIMPAMLLAL